MSRWLGRLLVAGAIAFCAGWGLVLASGYGGNSVGGSELVWRVGGLMVYAAAPALLLTLAAGLVAALHAGLRRLCRRA